MAGSQDNPFTQILIFSQLVLNSGTTSVLGFVRKLCPSHHKICLHCATFYDIQVHQNVQFGPKNI